MAEHQNKRDESETTATTPGGKEGAVESKSRGLFDFLGTSTTTPSGNEGDVETKSRGDRKSTRLNSSHVLRSRMPSSA